MTVIRFSWTAAATIGVGACSASTVASESDCAALVSPDERLMVLSDLDADVRDGFASLYSTDKQPGCLRIDLNGDNALEAAVIAIEPLTAKGTFRLYLGSARAPSELSLVVELALGAQSTSSFLSSANAFPRQTEGIPTTGDKTPGLLRVPVVSLVFFEKGQVDYVWDDAAQAVEAVQTAD